MFKRVTFMEFSLHLELVMYFNSFYCILCDKTEGKNNNGGLFLILR